MNSGSVRTHCGTLLVVSTVLAGAAGACRDAAPPTAAASPAATERATVWRRLGTWSGRGDRQTDSFDVATGALRLRWTATEVAPGAGRLRVSLHSAISGRPLQTVLDVRGGGHAEVHFEDEPRVSYLVIESDQVDWQVTVEEAAAR